jgi:hypothetical protein
MRSIFRVGGNGGTPPPENSLCEFVGLPARGEAGLWRLNPCTDKFDPLSRAALFLRFTVPDFLQALALAGERFPHLRHL